MKDNKEMNNIVEQSAKKRISDLLGITLREVEQAIESKKRNEDIIKIRHAYRYLLRKHTRMALTSIGMKSGMAHHSTVLNSLYQVEDALSFSFTNGSNRFFKQCDQLTFDNLIKE